MADRRTIWTEEEFARLSEPYKLVQVIREQVIPYEAEQRVRLSNGKARKYYVFGSPKTGGLAISRDSEGILVVSDRVLLGEFDTEEEARSFGASVERRIAELDEEKEEKP